MTEGHTMEATAAHEGFSEAPPLSSKGRIFWIDDEPRMAQFVHSVLNPHGYEVAGATDGNQALRQMTEFEPDLILLDLNMSAPPHGPTLCKEIRSLPEFAHVPIVVFTEMSDDAAIEAGLLRAGADDFIDKKRFDRNTFVARIEAVLRRRSVPTTDCVRAGPLEVYPARREVLIEGRPVNLTPTEFDILYKLARNRDRALTREELLDRGSSGKDPVAHRTVDVHILAIRRKLRDKDWLVSTVHRVGYRLGTAPGS